MTGDSRPQLRFATSPIVGIEVRDASGSGDGSYTISGHAAVFNTATTLYDGSFARVREQIAPGAFTKVLASQPLVHLNHGHDMLSAIAATNVAGVGGLQLTQDAEGLRFFARVPMDDPDAQRLAAKMRTGVVSQASFAFQIGDEDYAEGTTPDGRPDELFTIKEVSDLYDVCACAQGAYPTTSATLRGLAAAIGHSLGEGHRRDPRVPGRGSSVIGSAGARGDDPAAALAGRLHVARARFAVLTADTGVI